jgi:HEAT repeat protein
MSIWKRLWGKANAKPADVRRNIFFLQLRSGDPEQRRRAVLELGNSKDLAVVDPLIVALEDTNDDVRRGAAKALTICGSPDWHFIP